MIEVILKCEFSKYLKWKLLSLQQTWDLNIPSTTLNIAMEHGPNVTAFPVGRGISRQLYYISSPDRQIDHDMQWSACKSNLI